MPNEVIRKPWVLDEATIYHRFCAGEPVKSIAKDVKYSMRCNTAGAIGFVQKSILNQQELDTDKAVVTLRGSFGAKRIKFRG